MLTPVVCLLVAPRLAKQERQGPVIECVLAENTSLVDLGKYLTKERQASGSVL